MPEEKMDLRVAKTKKALALALFTLLEKRSFSKITVNDICQEAMISRTAFYSHFEDKYALLSFCIGYIKELIYKPLENMTVREWLCEILAEVQKNVKIMRNLIRSGDDAELTEMLRKLFLADFEKLIDDHNAREHLPGPSELVSTYYASGITGVVVLWINQDTVHSAQEVADCILQLLNIDESIRQNSTTAE